MEKTVKIYVLKNPETNNIHYVGRSVNPKDRYKVHIHLAKKSKHKNIKDAWICSLLSNNLKPLMEIIDETTLENGSNLELFWIEHYRKECDLKNSRDFIYNDYCFSEESRKKMSDVHKGKKLTDEQKLKIGNASKGNKRRLGKKHPQSFFDKTKIEITQLDKENNFIRDWSCANDASIELSICQSNICCVLNNNKNRKTAGGFKWIYKNKK